MRKVISFFVFTAVLVSSVCRAQAQEAISIDIQGPGQTRLNFYLPDPVLESDPGKTLVDPGRILQQAVRENLSFLPFFSLVPPEAILGGPDPGGYRAANMDFKKLSLSRVDIVCTTAWSPMSGILGEVELRAYEVFTQRLLVGKAYQIQGREQIARVAQRFCAALMQELTGNSLFFDSRLAYVKKIGTTKEVFVSSALGRDAEQVTRLKGICLSPAWSEDGRKLAFTYLTGREHKLGIWDSRTNALSTRVLPGNTIISPVFHPDGRVAVSLNPQGSPDIYFLDDDFSLDKALVEHWAIDISPSFDDSGRKMAFVSSRAGNPHVFVLDLDSQKVQRATFAGKYNTGADISPDGKFVAYSGETEDGHRIFVMDLSTGLERQVSFGPENDEDPSWSPDGYFLVFTSNRNQGYKIYMTTRFGDPAKLVPTGQGEAFSPAWGKAYE